MRPRGSVLGGLAASAALLVALSGCADDSHVAPVQQYLTASCEQWTALGDLQTAFRRGDLPSVVAAARRVEAAAGEQSRSLSRRGWPGDVSDQLATLRSASAVISRTARTITYATAPAEIAHIPDVSLRDALSADTLLRTRLHLPARCIG